ncbi:MAG TPA: RDD family protein [Bryobacteraceae bacterium]|nr:RDD family protein [Bryobacteraceae bacterium]
MQWFYAQGGQQIGPSEETEFEALVRSGIVRADTLVWHEGLASWQPLGVLRGYVGAPPAVPRARFAGFWIRFLARLIDGFILSIPTFVLVIPLLIMLGVAGARGRLSPFGPLPFGPAALMMQGVLMLISLAVGATYETYFVSTRSATPGKMALGLKIVRPDGSPVSAGLAFGRYLAHLLSGYLLGIGYLMAAFDVEKRALHDRMCETRVVYAR